MFPIFRHHAALSAVLLFTNWSLAHGPAKAQLIESSRGLSNIIHLALQPAGAVPELLAAAGIHVPPQRAEARGSGIAVEPLRLLASGPGSKRHPIRSSGPLRSSLANNVHEPAQEPLHNPEGAINFIVGRCGGRTAALRLTRARGRLRLRPAILFQENVTLSGPLTPVALRKSLTLGDGSGARVNLQEAVLHRVHAAARIRCLCLCRCERQGQNHQRKACRRARAAMT